MRAAAFTIIVACGDGRGDSGTESAGGWRHIVIDDETGTTVQPGLAPFRALLCMDVEGDDLCVDVTDSYALYNGALCPTGERDDCALRVGGGDALHVWYLDE